MPVFENAKFGKKSLNIAVDSESDSLEKVNEHPKRISVKNGQIFQAIVSARNSKQNKSFGFMNNSFTTKNPIFSSNNKKQGHHMSIAGSMENLSPLNTQIASNSRTVQKMFGGKLESQSQTNNIE